MFDPDSRYGGIETARLSLREDGGEERQIAYKRRRFIPPTEGSAFAVEHRVAERDRIDNLAQAYLGDPTHFWRLCDCNPILKPSDLTDETGRRIRIELGG